MIRPMAWMLYPPDQPVLLSMIYIIQTKLLPDYFKDVQLSEPAGGLDSNQMISTDDASDLANSLRCQVQNTTYSA